jgi:hypothetical protein
MNVEGGGPSWAASVAFEPEMVPEMVREMVSEMVMETEGA